jgi:Bacterial PH domain
MLGMLLIAVASPYAGDIIAKREWFGLILYPLIGIYSIVGIWLAVRMGVAVDEQGLTLRTFGRSRRIPWYAIDGIECDAYDARLVFSLYAPIITLAPEHSRQPSSFGLPKPTTKVAERIPLGAVGSYRRATAERRTDELVERAEAARASVSSAETPSEAG